MNPLATVTQRNSHRATQTLLSPANSAQRMAAMTLQEPASVPHLHSHFALDQLTAVARRSTAPQFVMLMAPIFGYDLPPRNYLKFQQALLAGSIENPEHRISHDLAYPADYDNDDRTIRIHADAFAEYLQAPERGWELLAILLHEFGHHVDNLLRHDLAEENPDGTRPAKDAQREEGSRYARAMAQCEATHEGWTCIGRYTLADTDEAEIVVDFKDAMLAVAHFQDGNGANNASGAREGFEAGNSDDHKDGHFSHETLSRNLEKLGFSADELQLIYFGNWLSDYSQLLDPKIVRAVDMPKDFPDVLSRQALTKIVDVLAARKFSRQRTFYPELFTVTEEKLGVYVPSEHIDNPKVTDPYPADPQTRDPDFKPWVFKGSPLLDVDYQSSMKRYIHDSVEHVLKELENIKNIHAAGERLPRLGAALHILEDYFAHSNFVELSLIKLGYNVLPWTGKADCKWELPLVTGTFGGLDVVASLAYPVAKLIGPVKAWEFKRITHGFRSDSEKMILILLGEHQNQDLLKVYEGYLALRDVWSTLPGHEYIDFYRWAATLPLTLIKNAYGQIFQGVFKLVGNSIGDIQTLRGDDPHITKSTDPSHSQLAKDHAEHPLHELAAKLASAAITEVTKALIDHWNYNRGTDPVEVARAFFVHPQDTQWQDKIVVEWAEQNPDAIRDGASKTRMDEISATLHKTAFDTFEEFKNNGTTAWEYIFNNIEEFFSLKSRFETKFDITKSGKDVKTLKDA